MTQACGLLVVEDEAVHNVRLLAMRRKRIERLDYFRCSTNRPPGGLVTGVLPGVHNGVARFKQSLLSIVRHHEAKFSCKL